MNFWSNKESRNIFLTVFAIITVAFLVNILLKLHMYGQRTTYAGESWLSTVSAIYLQNWLTEGIANLKFAMVRTYDSVEMRNFYDREVYASFMPGCLILPFLVAKTFALKPTLIFVESFASAFHYLGALVSSIITFKLCRRLELSKSKILWFTAFTGVAYIYAYINFRVLSFGYYTDTSIYLIYLIFLLTEFTKNPKLRLMQKAVLVFVGFCHEWFFVSITLVSIISEIKREDGEKRIGGIIAAHLIPTFIALGIYGYHLHILDKLEHSVYRMLRRSFFNPVSSSNFDYNYSDLWQQLFNNNKVIVIFTVLLNAWNFVESKFFKDNAEFRNLFIIAFGSSMLQITIALEHSAQHAFAGIKLLIPLCIFIPFFFDEISNFFKEGIKTHFLVVSLTLILLANLFTDGLILASFKKEHKIYSQLDQHFKDTTYEDLYFSYNFEILLDKYPKKDIKTSKKNVRPFDRVEGEPFLYYSAEKQVYLIDEPQDITKMLKNRDLYGKANVHILFYHKLCAAFIGRDFVQSIGDQLYKIDIPAEDLQASNFNEKYACNEIMYPYGYFGSSWVKLED